MLIACNFRVNVSIPKVRTPSKNGGFFLKRLGYAFAELPSKEEAERAVKELNDKSLDERRLSVKLARTMDKPRTKVSTIMLSFK